MSGSVTTSRSIGVWMTVHFSFDSVRIGSMMEFVA